MKEKLLLGAHMSIEGGVHTAFLRGVSIGCTVMQVFVKNNNRWNAPPTADEDIQSYKREEAKARVSPVIAHAAYLINLCATSADVLKKSRAALVDELRRCEAFGIKALVVHPGAHLGAGEGEGIKRIAESINAAHDETEKFKVLTALESTAGQGTTLGYRFEQLRAMIDLVEDGSRMAVCLDTCHLFAAGYDIGTQQGWDSTMNDFDSIVGMDRLVAIHVNDSKRERGSRVDRHEHIGKGKIGKEGFRALMHDVRLDDVPKILETPKSEDMHEDVENLNFLRSLVGKNA